MKKVMTSLLLLTVSLSANAVPNFWTFEYANAGVSEALITNSFNHELNISCDGNNGEHGVYLTIGNKQYSSKYDDNVSISVLIDGKKTVSVPSSADTRLGANEWNKFVKGISKASRIQVFVNNKKVTAFLPKKKGRKALKTLPKECSAKW